jgi:hypothetical protein
LALEVLLALIVSASVSALKPGELLQTAAEGVWGNQTDTVFLDDLSAFGQNAQRQEFAASVGTNSGKFEAIALAFILTSPCQHQLNL